MRRQRDIDGLRAIAVLPVMAFHFGIGAISGGFTGVDVFFVISGYVITKSIFADISAGKFGIVHFYTKRARRILPALIAMIVFSTCVAWLILLPEDLEPYFRSVRGVATFTSNIYFWRSSNYFSHDTYKMVLIHTWSLSLEEQFYVFIPVLIWQIAKWPRARALSVLGGLTLASVLACLWYSTALPQATFYLLPFRGWELLTGVLLAFSNVEAPESSSLRNGLSALGLSMIIGGMLVFSEAQLFPSWRALIPCVGTALVIYSSKGVAENKATFVSRFLSTKGMVGIGRISYSLYLVHWPIYAFTRYYGFKQPGPLAISELFLESFLAAWLIWHYIEDPVLKLKIRPRMTMTASFAVFAALLLTGETGIQAKGTPTRFPNAAGQDIPATDEWRIGTCFLDGPGEMQFWRADACTIAHGQRERILLWGDSFAAQYAPGITRNSRAIDADVLQYTHAGCPPILDTYISSQPDCLDFNSAVLSIIAEQHIDKVIVAGRWSQVSPANLEHLAWTIDALEAAHVQVILVGQSPEFPADVRRLDYLTTNWSRQGAVKWISNDSSDINVRLRKIADTAAFIDPVKALCDRQTCTYRVGSHYNFIDDGHLSSIGSYYAVRSYLPQLLAPAQSPCCGGSRPDNILPNPEEGIGACIFHALGVTSPRPARHARHTALIADEDHPGWRMTRLC